MRITARTAFALALLVCRAPAGAAAAETPARGIEWQSFEARSFEAAKKDNKLILLSIQAPWGHWDRLMSEITLADPNIAALVNDAFIPVKVDPLLRPDIWARYGMGGWPTTTFLLHSGQPVYFPDASRKLIKAGGTYYAVEPMMSYLQDLSKYYTANKEAVEATSDEISKGVLARKEVKSAPLTPDLFEVSVTKMLEVYGEWNPDPNIKIYRVPDLDAAELAFAYWYKKKDRAVLDTALHRLTDMARGGVHDQLGGGFHRLAADAAWRVPAFEKLLQVNAEMLQAYIEAYMVTGSTRYRDIGEAAAAYVMQTLADPAGWFYAYQAADSRLGEDGDYYTWTVEEAKAALTEEEQKILLRAYDIGEWGELINTAPRRNVLYLSEGPQVLSARLGMDRAKVTEIFESGRRKLLEARTKRAAPPVGKVLIADANADMATSLIIAGDLTRRPDLSQAGVRNLDFLWEKLLDPNAGLIDHAWHADSGRAGLAVFFADQVSMTRALIAAYESTGQTRHLERAAQIARAADTAFADALNGGWMDRTFVPDAPGFLGWPTRSIRDNARFAEALIRLQHLAGGAAADGFGRTVRKALESWADEFAGYKEFAASFGLTVDKALNPPLEVILVERGREPAGDGSGELLTQARSVYAPWKVVRHIAQESDLQGLKARQLAPPPGTSCFFCIESRCAGPFTKDDKLRARLDEFLGFKREPATGAAEKDEERP